MTRCLNEFISFPIDLLKFKTHSSALLMRMASCFDQFRLDNIHINWEEQRNNIAAIGAGLLVGFKP